MAPQARLGDVLVDERLIGRDQLQQASRAAKRLGIPLISVLLEQGLVEEHALVEALKRRLELEVFDPNRQPIEQDAVREVPFEEADRYRLLPVQAVHRGEDRVLRVAMADPLDAQAIEDIEFSTGSLVEPMIGHPSELAEAIRSSYRGIVTKVIPRARPTAPAPSPRPEPRRHQRPAFGGDLDESEFRTQPLHRAQKIATPEQKIDALVAILVRRDIITVDEYEEQLAALVGPHEEAP
jgi:hypothetical protein